MAEVSYRGVRRPLVAGQCLFDIAGELAVRVPSSCQRTGRCRDCVVTVTRGAGALSPRSAAEYFLRDPYRLSCQAVVERDDEPVAFEILRRRLHILLPSDADGLNVDPTVVVADGVVRYGDTPIDRGRDHLLGVALDIGTTTVVLDLVDLRSGQSLGVAAFENPQRFGGSDVLARIAYEADQPDVLRQALRRALNIELRGLYLAAGVERQEVYEMVVVGNPTMRDLFFGLDVQDIGRQPFRSVTEQALRQGDADSTTVVRKGHELGILMNPQGRVVGAPILGSHVGADAAADLVALDAANSGPFMVIDIGTNTEVIVGDRHRILAASCPAGPAFEGGPIRYGMPAADGAIDAVEINDGAIRYRTIGGAEPEGICGSGLVDLLAELRRTGWMTSHGRLRDSLREISIVPDRAISVNAEDIANLAQAKAANAVGQLILLRHLGLPPAALDNVYLAGGFANSMNIENAIAIGLLAPVAVDRIHRTGNAAINGARKLLLSQWHRRNLEAVAKRVEHIELEEERDFFDLFVDGFRFEPIEV